MSEFQRKNLKENYKSSEKLITHLGYDKNCYISFEMYEMMISLGYKINVKKILEYKHSNFMKPYIDFLFEKKSYYKKIGDIGMSNTFKILANSLFGVMMTRCEKFKDFKIVTKESQVDKQIKKPNFSCRNIINENLTILEMEKTSVVYNYPILIGSIVLQNSKYIDHSLFKKTLIENMKPDKISFNNISVKNQQIKTNTIIKNNIEFLNDKRYISNINENILHTLYIE